MCFVIGLFAGSFLTILGLSLCAMVSQPTGFPSEPEIDRFDFEIHTGTEKHHIVYDKNGNIISEYTE